MHSEITSMGKQQSKATSVSGDPQVNIINQLESHESLHEDAQIKLWLLIALNVIQMLLTLYKWHEKRVKRRAFLKGCKSTDALSSPV